MIFSAAMATMKKIDKRAREKESKHKRYAVAGVAKSKLTLNKSARKTGKHVISVPEYV